MKLSVTKKQARSFLLSKQLLDSPKSLSGKTGIETVFNTLRLLQYDPLNPCGRNVDLVLQARLTDYHPDDYYTWLYREKKGVECYDKELCIVPIADFPLTNLRRISMLKREETKQFLTTYERQLELLMKRIKKNGPITSAEIRDSTRVASGWGTDATFGRMALETLWRIGRIVVVKREQGRKYYDLPHTIHASLSADDDNSSAVTREHAKRRLQSVGLLPLSGGGGGWQGLGPMRKVIKELVDEGEFVEVQIRDCPRSYVISSADKAVMQRASVSKADKKVTFVAPLDNLMWDRQMILELFDFHYRWEVYTPVAKRAYGYYVLPILYSDTFIGRIEPVLSLDKTLTIRGFWQEKNLPWTKATAEAFTMALKSFAEYVQAKEIVNMPKVMLFS